MNTYELLIADNVSEENQEIIRKYWQLENEKFSFPAGDLKDQLGLSQRELSIIIAQHSSCRIVIGGCKDCGEEIVENVTSQTGFKAAIRKESDRCKHCDAVYWEKVHKGWEESRAAEQKLKVEQLADKKNHNNWKKLNPEELHVFKQILHWKKRNLIFSHVFSGNYNETWKIVNKLERLSLVQVTREGKRVLEFLFSDDFEFLLGGEEGQDQSMDKFDSAELYNTINAYTFNIPLSNHPASERSPKYSKAFTLPVDVCFEKGVEYLVGAWILTDGSININFRPRDTIIRSEDRALTAQENESWYDDPFTQPPNSMDGIDDEDDFPL
ncbi:hypothetical protein ACTJJ0_12450 [Chitinophaga sp. 22321]|uniref:HNH endonuclease n=1 Tax=Chitinophaga hostae TaxID=2831022 RepID=A0ABS5IWC7_9BACT|nr:hypothetical protein [Chitinophaga hostae]MBS0027269.1 hypothetical protein [Chitinophaga hostae]